MRCEVIDVRYRFVPDDVAKSTLLTKTEVEISDDVKDINAIGKIISKRLSNATGRAIDSFYWREIKS